MTKLLLWSMWQLSSVLTYTRCYHHYIKICLTEKGEICLVLTSPELFQICLHYVCNLYFHNIKVSAIFSSQMGRNKTHICDCISITGCSSAFAFLMLDCAPQWVTTSFWAETQPRFTLLCPWFSWTNMEHHPALGLLLSVVTYTPPHKSV